MIEIGKPEISFSTNDGSVINVEIPPRPPIDTLVSGEALLKRQDTHAPLNRAWIDDSDPQAAIAEVLDESEHARATKLGTLDVDGPIEYVDTQIRIPVRVGMSQEDRVKLANRLAEIVQEGLQTIIGEMK